MAHIYRTLTRDGRPHVKWRFRYVDWTGRRRSGTGTASREDTAKIAAAVEHEHHLIRLGYVPPPKRSSRHAKRPFEEVAGEYLAWGTAQGGRGGRPWGTDHARKRRMHLGWCVQRGYMAEHPLRGRAPFDTTPRSRRRAMTPAEVHALLDVAPPHRALLYEVAFTTGLRAKELRSLTVKDLDEGRGALLLHPEWTKNRKPGVQPLPRALVGRLRAFAEAGTAAELYRISYIRPDTRQAAPPDPLLYVPRSPSRAFAADCRKAGVRKWTPEGKVDFHSLRVLYVSSVLASGAGVLCRRSDCASLTVAPDSRTNVA